MTTDNMKKYLLPNLPYLLVFWFFAKVGESYRLAEGSDVFFKFINGIGDLGGVMSRPLPSLVPFDLFVGLLCTAAVYGIVWVRKKNAKKWRKDVEYGSARWGA